MPVFSRGVTPQAKRDLRRILIYSAPPTRVMILRAYQRLTARIRIDPHLKGVPAPMPGYPHLRRLDWGRLRMFFWVRQPPLMDLYVEVTGFSRF